MYIGNCTEIKRVVTILRDRETRVQIVVTSLTSD